MIAAVRGDVIGRGDDHLVVETGGIGFRIFTTLKKLAWSLSIRNWHLFRFCPLPKTCFSVMNAPGMV